MQALLEFTRIADARAGSRATEDRGCKSGPDGRADTYIYIYIYIYRERER